MIELHTLTSPLAVFLWWIITILISIVLIYFILERNFMVESIDPQDTDFYIIDTETEDLKHKFIDHGTLTQMGRMLEELDDQYPGRYMVIHYEFLSEEEKIFFSEKHN
jgi:hypothetical protein